MEILETAEGSDARATGWRDKRDRSGRTQDHSGRKPQDRSGCKQVQDRSGRKQVRVQQSGHANRAAKRQKAEAVAAALIDFAAASLTTAGSTAAGSASDPWAADSSAADSSAVDIFSSATVSSAVVSSAAIPSSALSSTIVSFAADTSAAISDDDDDPDAGWGSDGYWSSGLDLPMGETYIPLGEDEAELREHAKRAESLSCGT